VTQETSCEVHTPLKGAIDKGGEAASRDTSAVTTVPVGQVILRLSAMRKIDKDTRLLLLRGYIRSAQSGKLERVEVRVMVDTGAQADFISPALVEKLGGKIEHGRFGVALEAFGAETPLMRMLRAATLCLPGVHTGSLLAHDFGAERYFILAPPASAHQQERLHEADTAGRQRSGDGSHGDRRARRQRAWLEDPGAAGVGERSGRPGHAGAGVTLPAAAAIAGTREAGGLGGMSVGVQGSGRAGGASSGGASGHGADTRRSTAAVERERGRDGEDVPDLLAEDRAV